MIIVKMIKRAWMDIDTDIKGAALFALYFLGCGWIALKTYNYLVMPLAIVWAVLTILPILIMLLIDELMRLFKYFKKIYCEEKSK